MPRVFYSSEQDIELDADHSNFDYWHFRLLNQVNVRKSLLSFQFFHKLIEKILLSYVLLAEHTNRVYVSLREVHVQKERTKDTDFDLAL